MEDKRACPNCGHPVHSRPYLMSVHPDMPLPRWAFPAGLLLLFLFVVGFLQGMGL